GETSLATSAQLSGPVDVFVAPGGDYFIADTNNCRIRNVDAGTSTITTIAGTGVCGFSGDGGQATLAQINKPRGVALDGLGNILIADTENIRIRFVDAGTGTITTVAGTGAASYSGDGGLATLASMSHPDDVYVRPDGKYVIADTADNRIRMVDTGTGVITTV